MKDGQTSGAGIGVEDTRMFREAREAPDVVARQLAANGALISRLAARLVAKPPTLVLTCGRGSSDHAATFAKYLIETRVGIPTASAAPSVSSLYGARQKLDGALFLAISQSGESPDLLSAAAAARDAGALVVALVNAEASPLANLAHEVVALAAGKETSVAATKSFTASLCALAQLVAGWTGDPALAAALAGAPAKLEQAWALPWESAIGRLASARDLYVIGRGLGFAVAQEAALKLKETCALHAEPFSAAEVRHGPMALVGPGFPVLMFAQDDATRPGLEELAHDLAGRGASVTIAGAAPSGIEALPSIAAHPVVEPLLLIHAFYRAANALALARGYDPDRPPHLAKVTQTV